MDQNLESAPPTALSAEEVVDRLLFLPEALLVGQVQVIWLERRSDDGFVVEPQDDPEDILTREPDELINSDMVSGQSIGLALDLSPGEARAILLERYADGFRFSSWNPRDRAERQMLVDQYASLTDGDGPPVDNDELSERSETSDLPHHPSNKLVEQHKAPMIDGFQFAAAWAGFPEDFYRSMMRDLPLARENDQSKRSRSSSSSASSPPKRRRVSDDCSDDASHCEYEDEPSDAPPTSSVLRLDQDSSSQNVAAPDADCLDYSQSLAASAGFAHGDTSEAFFDWFLSLNGDDRLEEFDRQYFTDEQYDEYERQLDVRRRRAHYRNVPLGPYGLPLQPPYGQGEWVSTIPIDREQDQDEHRADEYRRQRWENGEDPYSVPFEYP